MKAGCSRLIGVRDVAEAILKYTGVAVPHDQIRLAGPIKEIGLHHVVVRPHAEVVRSSFGAGRSPPEEDMTTLSRAFDTGRGGAPHNTDAEELKSWGGDDLRRSRQRRAWRSSSPTTFTSRRTSRCGRQLRTLRRQPADRSDHGRRLLRRKELLIGPEASGSSPRSWRELLHLQCRLSTSQLSMRPRPVVVRFVPVAKSVGSLAMRGDIPIDEVLDSAEAEVLAGPNAESERAWPSVRCSMPPLSASRTRYDGW